MAAALQQYQACLGIMVRLQVEDLTALKQDFDRRGDRGLSITEFVSVMLDRVTAWEADSAIAFIQDLVELFAQVDVNGDGTMEWEEFTSAIIEGGMGTMSEDVDWRDLQYVENTLFADVLNRPPKRVQYLSEFKRLLVHDNTRPVVEIVDPSLLLPPMDSTSGKAGDEGSTGASGGKPDPASDSNNDNNGATFTPTLLIANKFHPLCYINGYRRDQDDVRSERSPVQALKYLSKVDLLAVSGGDLKLTFWASTILTASSTSALETPLPLAIVHTPRPQRVLEWNPSTQHLYSISADLVISVWHVTRKKHHDSKGKCEASLVTTLKQHTDLLQDLLLLNSETLVSCGMDNMIYLWDTQTLQVRATRQGHRRGVRLLTKLANHLFLSTGFECEVLGWDISTLATTPVFKLWGHNAPVCCVQLIQSSAYAAVLAQQQQQQQERRSTTEADDSERAATALLADQAITVDDDGWFKWWNLAGIASIENNDLESNGNRCLQTFRLGSDKYPWRAHTLAVLNNGQSVVAAGFHRLKLLQRVRLKPRLLPSSVVLYNSVSFTLLTTTDREIKIWDATTGALLRTFRNIASADISCVDLDARQRKIIFGTQRGELVVLNYMNGAILKTWTPHQLNVSALLYCKEDQCVLTVSWDRSLRLYDDNANANCLLRCVTDAHDTDIKCVAYCYAMSLIATGSADGVIKIWDYIYFLLEDTCSLPANGLAPSDVTALEFVEPYPLLVSCHENGLVCGWNVSPTQVSTLLFQYAPFVRDPTAVSDVLTFTAPTFHVGDEENRGGVCCCQVVYDEEGGEELANGIRRGRFLLVTASLDGEICVEDVSAVLTLFSIKAFRAESLPSNHFGSYNPRRRFIRQGKNAKRLKNHLKTRPSGTTEEGDGSGTSGDGGGAGDGGDGANTTTTTTLQYRLPMVHGGDIVQLAKWKAHHGVVRYVRVVDDPQTVLSCSADKSIKLWTLGGEPLGSLGGPTQPKTDPSSSGSSNEWMLSVDTETAAAAKCQQAEEIWNAMKREKLKLLASRHQSIKEAVRQRRRNSLGLTSSMSESLIRALSSSLVSANQEQEVVSVPEETDRLFRQLKGEATWKQSGFQLARQVAWEKERAKFQQRMQRILKKKSKLKQPTPETDQANQRVEESDAMADSILGTTDVSLAAGEDATAHLLPNIVNSTAHDLPFDDKDNWSVGGLNRQRQMYGHFHHETVRRSQKVLASQGSKLRQVQSMAAIDLAPSEFLLSRLGASCVIRDPRELKPVKHVRRTKPPRKKLGVSRLIETSSASTGSLLSVSGNSDSGGHDHSTGEETGVELPESVAEIEADSEATPSQSLRAVRSAPMLPSQPTIKELFLQSHAGDEKAHRASRLLVRTATLKPSALPALGEQEAPATTNTADTTSLSPQKAKPLSAPGRKSSAPIASPIMKPARSVSFKRDDSVTASKKQRIRSDTMLLRQQYFGPHSRDDIVSIYRTFHKIDKDGSGTITLHELVDGAGLFGSTHLKDNVMGIFSSIDKDQSGHIDLKELSGAIFHDVEDEVKQDIIRFYAVLESADKAKRQKKKQLTQEQLHELKQLFKLYDTDRNGDIDVDELFNALRYNAKFYDGDEDGGRVAGGGIGGSHITREDVERIIARFDMNTNSTLDLHEFIELFREEL